MLTCAVKSELAGKLAVMSGTTADPLTFTSMRGDLDTERPAAPRENEQQQRSCGGKAASHESRRLYARFLLSVISAAVLAPRLQMMANCQGGRKPPAEFSQRSNLHSLQTDPRNHFEYEHHLGMIRIPEIHKLSSHMQHKHPVAPETPLNCPWGGLWLLFTRQTTQSVCCDGDPPH